MRCDQPSGRDLESPARIKVAKGHKEHRHLHHRGVLRRVLGSELLLMVVEDEVGHMEVI